MRALAGLLIAALVPLHGAAPPFKERMRDVVETYAHPKGPGDSGYATIAAKLWLGEDAAWCSKRLEQLLAGGPTGDMFWMFPVTAIAYLGQNKLTPSAMKSLRGAWKTYMPYRGDTENHWLLYYTSLYLMAQMWPDEPGSAWYTGKPSAENFREAESWIKQWMELTITRGQGEYDCTHYIGVYLLPLSYLKAWAKDAEMRQRATMMIEYIMADYAVENLDGIYVGSHARTDDKQVLEKWNGVSSDLGWLLFGVGWPLPVHAGYTMYYAVASGYEPPEVIQKIATDRSQPYVHKELKRTRHRWRFFDERNGRVYKTTYMRKEYAVGSDQGGVLQPVQQHSWDVTWAVKDPRGVHNTLFTIHPFSSLHELQTYFTFAPDFGTESVVRSKKSYDSPDKFLGGSPFEKLYQEGDAVIVLYDIPPGTRFPHINGFFSKDLSYFEEHPSGWIFVRGGDAWIAYRPLAQYSWMPMLGGDRRLFSPYLKNGAVVQSAPASEYPDIASFRKAILALPIEIKLEPTPSVQFTSLRGKRMEFTFGKPPVNYDSWQLFEGPFLNSARDSRKLVLTHGTLRRELDFKTLTVR